MPTIAITEHYQRGWSVIRQGAALLRSEFGVVRVAVFGSMLDAARVTERSDVDLAVWGLSDGAYWAALGQLLAIDPAISVDLVQADRAGRAPMLAAIDREAIDLPLESFILLDPNVALSSAMSSDPPNSPLSESVIASQNLPQRPVLAPAILAVLVDRLRYEQQEIRATVDRVGRLLAKAIASGDNDYFDAVALNLQSFYTGVERCLELIARDMDGAVPSGTVWHRDLLRQMAADRPGHRPAVISAAVLRRLDQYRALRHVIHNLYAVELEVDRLRSLAEALPDCAIALDADLHRFVAHFSF